MLNPVDLILNLTLSTLPEIEHNAETKSKVFCSGVPITDVPSVVSPVVSGGLKLILEKEKKPIKKSKLI